MFALANSVGLTDYPHTHILLKCVCQFRQGLKIQLLRHTHTHTSIVHLHAHITSSPPPPHTHTHLACMHLHSVYFIINEYF